MNLPIFLDMELIDALVKAIKEFEGGVIIVSHDFRTFPFPSTLFVLGCLIYSNPLPHLSRPHLTSRKAMGGCGQEYQDLTKHNISIID